LDEPAVTTRMFVRDTPRSRSMRVISRGISTSDREFISAYRFIITPLLRLDGEVPFRDLLRSWFELWETHRDVITLLQAARRGLELTPELSLVTAVQAVEGFHRGSEFNQTVRSEDEHTALMSAVNDLDIGNAEKSWLKDRTRWNEPSARRRLKDLCLPVMEEPLGLMIGNKDRLDRFISIAIGTRNSITHRLPDDSQDVWTDDLGLSVLAEGLNLIVTCHLLASLGLPFAEQHERLRKSPRFRFSQDWFQPLLYERDGQAI